MKDGTPFGLDKRTRCTRTAMECTLPDVHRSAQRGIRTGLTAKRRRSMREGPATTGVLRPSQEMGRVGPMYTPTERMRPCSAGAGGVRECQVVPVFGTRTDGATQGPRWRGGCCATGTRPVRPTASGAPGLPPPVWRVPLGPPSGAIPRTEGGFEPVSQTPLPQRGDGPPRPSTGRLKWLRTVMWLSQRKRQIASPILLLKNPVSGDRGLRVKKSIGGLSYWAK